MGATELKGLTRYKYNDLKAATKKFSEKNKLGEGGFGAVYKVNFNSSLHFNCNSNSFSYLFNINLSPGISIKYAKIKDNTNYKHIHRSSDNF